LRRGLPVDLDAYVVRESATSPPHPVVGPVVEILVPRRVEGAMEDGDRLRIADLERRIRSDCYDQQGQQHVHVRNIPQAVLAQNRSKSTASAEIVQPPPAEDASRSAPGQFRLSSLCTLHSTRTLTAATTRSRLRTLGCCGGCRISFPRVGRGRATGRCQGQRSARRAAAAPAATPDPGETPASPDYHRPLPDRTLLRGPPGPRIGRRQ
jgi:hypothetical protein